MKKRNYIAMYDDGHDFGVFEFSSTHRANSNANIEDAKAEAKRKYGFKRANSIVIYATQLYKF